jgi:primosomal replication protein N
VINQAILSGAWHPDQTLRYTPAGVPVLEARLVFEGTVSEMQVQRKVQGDIKVKVLGGLANMAGQIPAGAMVKVQGFLAPPRHGAKTLVLHAQTLKRTA